MEKKIFDKLEEILRIQRKGFNKSLMYFCVSLFIVAGSFCMVIILHLDRRASRCEVEVAVLNGKVESMQKTIDSFSQFFETHKTK